MPPRLPLGPRPVAPGATLDLFDPAAAPVRRPSGPKAGPKPAPQASPKAAPKSEPAAPKPRAFGPVAELRYEAGPFEGEAGDATAAGPFEPWRPSTLRVAGAVAHPTPLVQSGAMAAVAHPRSTYRPMLPERVITEGLLSDAQLESVVLAGQAHEGRLSALYRIGEGWETVRRVDGEHERPIDTGAGADANERLSAPVRLRKGWMLGDGTGCGKGRQVAALILDQWLRGRKRALWLSQSDKLLEDARRDWTALGGAEADVIALAKVRQGAEIPQAEGILFATYATLRSPARQGKRSRLEQVVGWLAGGLDEAERHAFSGVVVFDEAHAMANAAGSKGNRGEIAPSQQGRAGLRLQNALPDARIVDSSGERLALKTRPASASLAETAAFMDGIKRILVFSMAGGTGRSYHADLGCANLARRVHYLLEAGWRADQAIQGLGRTHRTHQASAPLFRPITTDVKGERRFIATIARRLDSLGAITRGQRDSQTAMGGGDATLFRASDNLESAYAKAALRQLYLALCHGAVPEWPLARFEEATGLKLTWDGVIREDLPPMPRFLNRLLALPIDEQNALFAALEVRIEAAIEQAVEAGTFERGVETIHADGLAVASREPLFVHEGSGAVTELVEIARRDRLEPLTADAALRHRDIALAHGDAARLMVNARSGRVALATPAPSLMRDDGGVEKRVRLVRPAGRDTVAANALAASSWTEAAEPDWRALWDAEVAALPSHTESRFWLVAGLLLPLWDRLPGRMRVRRLATDAGEALIGRVFGGAEAAGLRDAFGLAGGLALTPAEMHEALVAKGTAFTLGNGWRLARRRAMGELRIELEGPADGDLAAVKRMGCTTEIVSWRTRVFVPGEAVLARLVERWPLRDLAAAA